MTMNITTNEQAVISALKDRDGGIYSKEIAAYSGLSKAAVAGVVSSLVQKGIVEKETVDGDEYLSLAETV